MMHAPWPHCTGCASLCTATQCASSEDCEPGHGHGHGHAHSCMVVILVLVLEPSRLEPSLSSTASHVSVSLSSSLFRASVPVSFGNCFCSKCPLTVCCSCRRVAQLESLQRALLKEILPQQVGQAAPTGREVCAWGCRESRQRGEAHLI